MLRTIFSLVAVLSLQPAVVAESPRGDDTPRVRLLESVLSFDIGQDGVREMRMRPDGWASLSAAGDRVVVEGVPLKENESVDVRLERFSVAGPDTAFVMGRLGGEDEVIDFDASGVQLWRGVIDGHPGSSAFLAVTDDGVMGTFDVGPGEPRIVLGSVGQRGMASTGLRFAEAAGFGAPPQVSVCGVPTPDAVTLPSVGGGEFDPDGKLIEIAVETDYEYYQLFGDEQAACEYILSLYGAVSAIYARDLNASIDVTFVRIWDTPADLFNEPNPLSPFGNHWNVQMNSVTRDVAMFVTGRRNLPYGGVAWVSGLCGESGYSVVGYILGSFADPNLPSAANWDIIVTAHELGHNCGTFHTHDYGIDSCASGAVQRGTIMSYCHTSSGGNGNIDLRFHGNIQQVVGGFLAGLDCLDRDCNHNGTPDNSEIFNPASQDSNSNGILDVCEDCNHNGMDDAEEIAAGTVDDVNGNGRPDECEPDCNNNGVPDSMDISTGSSQDLYGDGVPDECEQDCNDNGTSDYIEIQGDMSLDLDRNAVLDSCQDCDDDGISDLDELGGVLNIWVASESDVVLTQFHSISGVPVRDSAATAAELQDMVIGVDGLIYATSAADDSVVILDPSSGASVGVLVSSGAGGLDEPGGLTFGPDGFLYVASRGNDTVLKYNGVTGAHVAGFSGPLSGALIDPFGVVVNAGGDLLVTSDDDRILRLDRATGALLGQFVSDGNGLNNPRGLLFTPNGHLLVASFGSDAVLEYDETGAFIRQFDQGGLDSGFWGLAQPWAIAMGPRGDVVLVTSHQGNAAVHSYDLQTGQFMRSYYVLAQDIADATGLVVMGPSPLDCDLNLVPDACESAACACAEDTNGDLTIDVQDLVAVIVGWGPCGAPCAGDVNADNAVDILDLLAVILAWGDC